ncbi:hypothetical protein CCP2SC5_1020023 [Azospirillaceae bacterium]
MQWILSALTGVSGPIGWIANIILNFFWGKAVSAIQSAEKDKANHEANAAQAEQDIKKAQELKPDSTEKDVDDAIDDELSHF